MEVILKQYVKGLGDKNDLVTVKAGYGRNYLIPQGLAMIASTTNRKILDENIRQSSHRQEKLMQDAHRMAEGLKEMKLVIETLAGADGKIFGSVTPLQFSNRLKELGFDVDRRRISFDTDIKNLGSYVAQVALHKELIIEVPFEVVLKG
jgi:large subunit ribosomal protein L9